MKLVLHLCLLFQCLLSIAAKEDSSTSTTTEHGSILVVGDSWASLSGDYMANICGPQTTRPIQNDAKSGSTADDWASGEIAVKSMTNAKYDYDYVWLSVGGNDFLDSQCDLDIAEEVATNIVTIISHIVDNSANEKIKILYLGYSYPSADICGNGKTTDLFDEQGAIIRSAIKNSGYASYVTVMDISSEFVTYSSKPLSDPSYYADYIHLNELGYLKLFSKIRIQMFFGCSGVVMPVISAVYQAKGWSMAHTLGVAVGTLAALLAVCLLLPKFCTRNKKVGDVAAAEEQDNNYVVLDPNEPTKKNEREGANLDTKVV